MNTYEEELARLIRAGLELPPFPDTTLVGFGGREIVLPRFYLTALRAKNGPRALQALRRRIARAAWAEGELAQALNQSPSTICLLAQMHLTPLEAARELEAGKLGWTPQRRSWLATALLPLTQLSLHLRRVVASSR